MNEDVDSTITAIVRATVLAIVLFALVLGFSYLMTSDWTYTLVVAMTAGLTAFVVRVGDVLEEKFFD